jgi:propanol-preferring alcohol dehydrogenase
MRAMILHQLSQVIEGATPLSLRDVPRPEPGPGEVLVRVTVCGVCHTELDEIEGRTPPPRLPVIPGHQAVGVVAALGAGVLSPALGERVGVAWVYSACGQCEYCIDGRENLCPDFRGTGRDANGGYAEYMNVPVAFAHPLPDGLSDAELAPLLCAGAVGYRSLRLTKLEDGQRLGLTGFGASAHLVLQTVRHQFPRSDVYVFARNAEERLFAFELGAAWGGDTADRPPHPLHAIIDTTPAWKPVLAALANLAPGGRLVINAIRKEDADRAALLELSYAEHLWQEKEIKSVANVTRGDISGFLEIAAAIPLHAEVTEYPLEEANRALVELRTQRIRGAKVLRIG